MSDKIVFLFVYISFLIVFIGVGLNFLENLNQYGDYLIDVGFKLFQFWGAYLMFKNGTTKDTLYWKIIRVLLVILVFGIAFKIMHWSFAGIMLMISLLGISFTYLVRFVTKNDFSVLSILKFLWLFSTGIITFLALTKITERSYYAIPFVLFWVLFIFYLSKRVKKEEISK
ncbi:hypothetical protein WAF17_06560 [Bernardetia sp. ABR2-2B]|uniref:hypothetical protein n=1 Tax=Bernardetia sp. ABR2-2B TaxID=3127472 RepID=UPI0030CD2AEE